MRMRLTISNGRDFGIRDCVAPFQTWVDSIIPYLKAGCEITIEPLNRRPWRQKPRENEIAREGAD